MRDGESREFRLARGRRRDIWVLDVMQIVERGPARTREDRDLSASLGRTVRESLLDPPPTRQADTEGGIIGHREGHRTSRGKPQVTWRMLCPRGIRGAARWPRRESVCVSVVNWTNLKYSNGTLTISKLTYLDIPSHRVLIDYQDPLPSGQVV